MPWHWRDPYARVSVFLTQSDHWEAEQVAAWQLDELNRLLKHAKRHCPGHKRKLHAIGFNGPLERVEDLAQLPFFTKAELRDHGDEFTARNFAPESLRAITSGGTTGRPTRVMVEARSYDAVFDAWRHAMWRRAGYVLGMRCLDITWAFEKGGPFRLSSEPNRVYLSIHALDAKAFSVWWQRVSAFQPDFIIGFPSTAAALAKTLPAPAALPTVRALLLSSETLTADQRATLIASFPRARIFQWYGMSELAGFASGCEYADAFHHWPQSGVLEVIGEDDRPMRIPGQSGEIVLTGFANRATPFIRYRTGDCGMLGNRCQHCGRADILLASIEGRVSDFLLGKQGRVVPISALNFHGDEFRHVFAHQFVQDEPGQVVLRIVPLPSFTDYDVMAISALVREKLGADMTLTIEQVEFIPRTPRGKQPLIVRRCPSAHANLEHQPVIS